ncbi:MAG: SAM-dependent methyltransferase [Candidatus Azotimanducaceae bacterium]|jgi:SAM-dependent methyltransferase
MVLEEVRPWFESPLGTNVLETEMAIIDQLLPGFFGYHLLQLSVQSRLLYESSPIRHKFSLTQSLDRSQRNSPGVLAQTEFLPFEEDSIDVVLLHHLLDFHESPQNLLREVTRVARPNGQVVIVGFNPLSLWGAYKPIGALRKTHPWQGKFIRPGRLMDWLNLLNFKIDRAQYSMHGLPYQRKEEKKISVDYSQGLSRNHNWPFGAIYVIVAHKQVGTMTPIRPVWRGKRNLNQLSVVRPAAGREIANRNFPTDLPKE